MYTVINIDDEIRIVIECNEITITNSNGTEILNNREFIDIIKSIK